MELQSVESSEPSEEQKKYIKKLGMVYSVFIHALNRGQVLTQHHVV